MSFTLEVDFSGLCMYVEDPDAGEVRVLMPDCRRRTHGDNPFHADETRAVHHVGYVRIDLADLGVPLALPTVTGDKKGEPRYELIHRFDRQILHFEGDAAPAPVVGGGLPFPDFEAFAPGLELIDGLFDTNPPSSLLMRTILSGGTFVGRTVANPAPVWTFSKLFSPDREAHGGQFASFATWSRPFEGNTLTLRITSFDGVPEAEFTLGPVPEKGVLHLDVANLCADNPLEWTDLKTHKILGNDEDFKWMYRLVKPKTGTFESMLLNTTFPIPARMGVAGETGDDDCFGATIKLPRKEPVPE